LLDIQTCPKPRRPSSKPTICSLFLAKSKGYTEDLATAPATAPNSKLRSTVGFSPADPHDRNYNQRSTAGRSFSTILTQYFHNIYQKRQAAQKNGKIISGQSYSFLQ